MVIVLGSVTVRTGGLEEALRLSLEHVERSRQEPGCIHHAVHQDAEDPNRLVFVEKWEDMKALEQHFGVPESRRFVSSVAQLATAAPEMSLYESSEVNSQGR